MSRTVTVHCPAIPQLDGKPALTFVRLAGHEKFDELFAYTLELKTPDARNPAYGPAADVDLKKFVGQECSVRIELDGEGSGDNAGTGKGMREINGIVTAARISRIEGRHVVYALELRPWLWLATRTADFQIFQEKNVVDILDTVLGDYAFPVDKRLSGEYPTREYTVQYGETDFAFMQRLMQEWGISWFFEHAQGKHRLVLCDHPAAYSPHASVAYKTLRLHAGGGKIDEEHLTSFELAHNLTTGVWTCGDFDFTKPHADLTAVSRQQGQTAHNDAEVYEWPGDYAQPDEGDSLARTRMEALRTPALQAVAAGSLRGVVTGCTFMLEDHPHTPANTDWLVLDTNLTLEDVGEESGAQQFICRLTFTAHPAREPYRPDRTQPKPFTHGPQTAIVTGPDGQEIWTDKYGRVKVQFHWDRIGTRNEKSSCWVRVSQPWAGENFGAMHIPRIGQEVIVDFLLGDPDCPIITGRVYNASNMPPWDLPDNATQSGILTRSTKQGSKDNANALRFEDKKGEEEVWLHAEKDQRIEVENDESHWVGHNRTKEVDHDELVTIGHDRTETVGFNEIEVIGINRIKTVGVNETDAIGVNWNISVGAFKVESIGSDCTQTVGKNKYCTVGQHYNTTVNKDCNITVSKSTVFTTGDSHSVKVGSNQNIEVEKDRTVRAGKNISESADENINFLANKSYGCTAQKEIILDAGEKFKIVCGESSLIMDKEGNITLKGKDIAIESSGEQQFKADKNITLKGQKILEN